MPDIAAAAFIFVGTAVAASRTPIQAEFGIASGQGNILVNACLRQAHLIVDFLVTNDQLFSYLMSSATLAGTS
jgi:hypothetical protein